MAIIPPRITPLHWRTIYHINRTDKQRLITSFTTFTGGCDGYYTSMNDSVTSENYLSY